MDRLKLIDLLSDVAEVEMTAVVDAGGRKVYRCEAWIVSQWGESRFEGTAEAVSPDLAALAEEATANLADVLLTQLSAKGLADLLGVTL